MEKKRLKICFLSAHSGTLDRGIENWTQEIARRLTQKRHWVRVYQLGNINTRDYEAKQVSLKVDWQKKDTSRSLLRWLGLDYWSQLYKEFALKLLPDLSSFNPDIVVPLNGGPENSIIKRYCQKSESKLVLVGHWHDLLGLWQNPDLYLATSDKQKKWVEKIYRGRIETIPNGVDLGSFSPQGDKYAVKVPHPAILTVGALTKGKNIDITIRAVSKIPKVGLIVCGDGDLKNQYLALGQKLLGERFQLLSLKAAEMPSLYRACNLFTLVPDKSEAFGLVFLEAMACGLGVVTIDDEVRRKIIGPAGLLVKKIKGEEYVSALKKALDLNFRKAARQQAEKYSWDKVAEEYERAFLSLFEKGR